MGVLDFLRHKLGRRRSRARPASRKGAFTQCVCVLLDSAPRVAAVEASLAAFEIARQSEVAPGEHGWALGGPGFLLPFRPALNGYAQVDIVNRPWPDRTGAATGPEAQLFGAWALGHFGPHTHPGSLGRAAQHSQGWAHAPNVAANHAAFVRVRTSYVFGAAPDALVLPDDYDALAELRFVNDVALALASLAGTLAVFNPAGELLLSPADLRKIRIRERSGGAFGVDSWANVRKLSPQLNAAAPWVLFDTVGMGQVDLRDHEGAAPAHGFDARTVPSLLYSMAEYDLERRGVLGTGDTASDLNGARWRARADGDALVGPPRPVLRWFPDDHEVPAALLGDEPFP